MYVYIDFYDDSDGVTDLSLAKKKPRRAASVEEVDDEGFLKDITLQELKKAPPKATIDERRRDVDHFFSAVFKQQGKSGADKGHRKCNTCSCVLSTGISSMPYS